MNWLEIIAVGGILYWSGILVFLGSLWFFGQKDEFWSMGFTVILGLVAFEFLVQGTSLLTIFSTNPWLILGIVVGYFVGGLIWCSVKWTLKMYRAKELYNEYKDVYCEKRCDIPDVVLEISRKHSTVQKQFLKALTAYNPQNLPQSRYYKEFGDQYPPSPASFKGRLVGWAIWWPVSFITSIFDDPIRWIFEGLISFIGKYLEKISKKILPDMD